MIKEVQNGTKQIGSEEKAREKQLLEIQKFINLKWVYIERQVTMIWLYNQQQKSAVLWWHASYIWEIAALCILAATWTGIFDGRRSMHSKDPHSVEGSSPTHVNHKQQLVATCRNLRKVDSCIGEIGPSEGRICCKRFRMGLLVTFVFLRLTGK